MKRITIFTICIVALCSCQKEKYKETILFGTIDNSHNTQVLYTTPCNGFSYIGFRDTLLTETNGTFKIKCNLRSPGLIQFYYKRLYTVFVEPGDSLAFLISKETINIDGNNSIGNEFLNNLDRPFYAQSEARKFQKDTLASSLVSKINDKKFEEYRLLDSIKQTCKLGEEIYSFLHDDIHIYYQNLISEITALHYYSSYHTDPQDIKIPISIDSLWEATYEKDPIGYKKPVYSNWWYDYALNYISAFSDYNNNTGGIGNQHTKVLERATKVLNGHNLEVFLARYIHTFGRQNKLEPELIKMYNTYIAKFPDSPFDHYVFPEIKKIIKFQENLNNLNPEIEIITDYEEISSLEDLISRYKGKVIYIDIWATWCGPCLDEFRHYEELYKRYKNSEIEFIFLSTDRSNMKQRWLEMIKGYELKGHHLLANIELQNDLHRMLNDSDGKYFIPRYILINPNGEIINCKANKPSENELLIQQLDETLQLNKQ